jgi:hypothetical protein
VEDLAAEGAEILGSAIGVGAANAGDAFKIVAAVNKAFDGLDDALQARASQPVGVFDLKVGGKLGEVAAEQPMQRAGASLPVGAWWCGLQSEAQRIGRTID